MQSSIGNAVSAHFGKYNRYELEHALRNFYWKVGEAANKVNRCVDTLDNVYSANGGYSGIAKRIKSAVTDSSSDAALIPFFYGGANDLTVEEASNLLRKGDHIRVRLYDKQRGGFFYHHGIYCGGDTVIEYNGRYASQDLFTIEKCSLNSFARGKRIEIDNRERSLYSPDEIVARAESRLGERAYNLYFNNCETFATWCRSGPTLSRLVS